MQITHNEIMLFWWLVVAASSGTVGALLAWWRLSYRLGKCCDCCTCEDCGESEDVSWREGGERRIPGGARPVREPFAPGHLDWIWRDEYGNEKRGYDGAHPVAPDRRRTVVLEPGPTIYRALVPVDDESLYGPESHVKPFDSTFIRTVLMDWERRYPIPQDSPNGNM